MTNVVVVGTSGHARVCIDTLRAIGYAVVGCVGGAPCGAMDVPHLGGDECLATLVARTPAAFVAVGDNLTRQRLFALAASMGFDLVSAVHPSAVISPSAHLGSNVLVVAGSVINAYARLDDGVIVNTGASVDHDCHIHAFAHVAPGARLAGNVELGEGAFVGVGASVTPGRRVGAWSIVGAGAAVIRDVADGHTVVGVPAISRLRDEQ